ncbi:uncharacterized protein LOC130894793 isoform X2 [Diorhabda carinulata]|uniref:uncharacterized protein LOC130894793 isoform X2 n=1 Tax=Diorhabda carinulata TaxID=1163345 RepID=UPI0025A2396C|nr:uncharacterized protein LOC130894793 isoform X2 [Diorhabda carinulata]
MSKRVKACCVPGCTNKQAIRNEDVCRIWLPRINNPKLMRANTVLTSHRICDIHFEQICRNPNGRLKKLSLPTLHLPGINKILKGKDQQYKDYDVVMNMAYVKYRKSCKKDNGNH